MVRASQAYKICTNRPSFDLQELIEKEQELADKVRIRLDQNYEQSKIESIYVETMGLKTIAREVLKLLAKQRQYEYDPLPPGAKAYLQEIWLEHNYNLFDFSLTESQDFATVKGIIVESDAIDVLGAYYDMEFCKNQNRITFDFISGECDILYNSTVRDVKCPVDWKSFRKKDEISLQYHWQLISYCYLYNADQAFLDYVLMPVPEELIGLYTRFFNDRSMDMFRLNEESIENLPLKHRIKTYKLESNIQEDIEFLTSRLQKAEEYYNRLTYRKCMRYNS